MQRAPSPVRDPKTALRRALSFVAFTAAYYAGAYLSLTAARPEGTQVALFWIPTGLALAWVYFEGLWLAAGIPLALILLSSLQHRSPFLALTLGIINSFSVVMISMGLREVGDFRPSFKRGRDVLHFILAATAACITSGVAASVVIVGVGPGRGPAFLEVASQWGLAEALSVLAISPFFLTNFSAPFAGRSWPFRRWAECLLLAAFLATAAYFVFLEKTTHPSVVNRISMLLPLFLWAGLRFGPRVNSLFIAVVALLALVGAVYGLGSFSGGDPKVSLVDLQLHLAIYCACTLLITAVSYERATLAGERERRLREIADGISQLVWVTDARGEMLFANKKYVEFLGPGSADVGSLSWSAALHPEDRAAAKECWESALRAGTNYSNEYRLRRQDGTYHWFLGQASPLRDAHGVITQWFGTSTNIDEQRDVLRQLEEEKRVRDRMVFTLSHDIRNPLSIIAAGAQVLLKTSPPPELATKFLEQIQQNVVRANRMIVDLLDANRLRAGVPVPLKVEELDLAALLRETIATQVTVHGDLFRVEAPGELVGHWASDELRRVIENLCANAVKYGDPARGVTVSAGELVPGGDVFLSVHNYGRVIAEVEKKEIFRLFHRTRDAEGGPGRGWGIGLTLVKGFTAAHGGQVDVTSDSVGGTRFTVQLPRDARAFGARPAGPRAVG